jgi:hypothetical protein
MAARKITKAVIAANDVTLFDKAVLRTSAGVGYAVNHAQAAAVIAPIGYQTARAKHNIDARINAARAYAASI